MCKKEYYQYLNEIWSECKTAAAENKELAKVFFDKAASPEYYWKQNTKEGGGGQTSNNNQPMIKVILSSSEIIDLKNDEEARDNLKSEHFRYDKKKYVWEREMKQSSWDFLKAKYPFKDLKATIK